MPSTSDRPRWMVLVSPGVERCNLPLRPLNHLGADDHNELVRLPEPEPDG
jgi:hypothetical protein